MTELPGLADYVGFQSGGAGPIVEVVGLRRGGIRLNLVLV